MLIITMFTIFPFNKSVYNQALRWSMLSRPSNDFWEFCHTLHAPKFGNHHSAPDIYEELQT